MALRSTNPALSARIFEQYAGTTGETIAQLALPSASL